MGAAKPLMPFRGAALMDTIIARATPQVARLAIDVHRDEEQAYRARYGGMVVPDLFSERLGPLCGIVTGLAWLEADWLATFPCDTPLLPLDLVAQLARDAGACPVAARHGGRLHGVCGLWPKSCLERLKVGVESGALRSMRCALDAFEAVECEIAAPRHAFFNVNAPDDLKRAEALSR
jgi:molybdopterin-guanine dinucleotide biosynthesis protein A